MCTFLPKIVLLEMAASLLVWEVWESDLLDSHSPADRETVRSSSLNDTAPSAGWKDNY